MDGGNRKAYRGRHAGELQRAAKSHKKRQNRDFSVAAQDVSRRIAHRHGHADGNENEAERLIPCAGDSPVWRAAASIMS